MVFIRRMKRLSRPVQVAKTFRYRDHGIESNDKLEGTTRSPSGEAFFSTPTHFFPFSGCYKGRHWGRDFLVWRVLITTERIHMTRRSEVELSTWDDKSLVEYNSWLTRHWCWPGIEPTRSVLRLNCKRAKESRLSSLGRLVTQGEVVISATFTKP